MEAETRIKTTDTICGTVLGVPPWDTAALPTLMEKLLASQNRPRIKKARDAAVF